MKIFIFVVLMVSAGGAGAADLIECQMYRNYVSLQFVEPIDSNRTQTMIFELGKEQDIDDPYKVRRLCEALKAEIKERVGWRWSEEECNYPSPGTGIQYKQIGFQITPFGAERIHSQSQIIWFGPTYNFVSTPIDTDFFRIINPSTRSECANDYP